MKVFARQAILGVSLHVGNRVRKRAEVQVTNNNMILQ